MKVIFLISKRSREPKWHWNWHPVEAFASEQRALNEKAVLEAKDGKDFMYKVAQVPFVE